MNAYDQKIVIKAILWGIMASFFLSGTFIINSLISNTGGHWAWTSNLRSLFLIPILGVVLLFNKGMKPLIQAIRAEPMLFLKWGTLGFGVLYTAVAIASLFSPGWMVAAIFQINILAGMLQAPFIYKDHRRVIPKRALMISGLIVAGVFIMQLDKMSQLESAIDSLISFGLVLLGAIVWPLGNRQLMVKLEEKSIRLNALQRVLGLSIGCLPLLIALGIYGFMESGLPPLAQCQASFYSAFVSGFLGGVGFYQATQMIHQNPVALSTIEATQVFEILFTLAGEMLLVGTTLPGPYGIAGIVVVLTGISIHFWNSLHHTRKMAMKISA